MIPRPPRSTRTYTLFPYTTLFRSVYERASVHLHGPSKLSFLNELRQFKLKPGYDQLIEDDTAATREKIGQLKRNIEALRAVLMILDKYLHFQRSEEHTSELQSLMRISYAVFCLKKKTQTKKN